MIQPNRDRRRSNDLICLAAMRDVEAVLDRHRVDRESDEIAFAAITATLRTLTDSLVELDPASRGQLRGLLDELGTDPARIEAWHRFEDFVEHWFVLARHVVFGLRPEAIPDEVAQLQLELRRALRSSAPTASSARPASATILLIDDSAVVLAVVEDALTSAGFQVESAGSFREAEALLRKVKPHLVLTDVCLPDVEGDDVCARLKMRAGHLVPVVLMSNLPELELARRAQAARADAFLSKRHGPSHVVDVVTALLDELIL